MSGVGFRLSPVQEALWLKDRPGDTKAYLVLAIEGSTTTEQICQALTSVIIRHEALRTRLATRPGVRVPLQVINAVDVIGAEPLFEVREVNVRAVDARSARELEELVSSERIDCERGPLVRALIARTGGELTRLALVLPALFVDLWSLSVIARDLAFALDGREPAEAPIQYADFAAFAEQHARYQVTDRSDTGATDACLLPRTIQGWPRGERFEPRRVDVPLSASTGTKLEGIAQRAGAKPDTTLLALFAVVLARFAEQWHLSIGVIKAGRAPQVDEAIDLSGAVGLFAECIPTRAQLDPSHLFSEVVRALHHEGQGVPMIPGAGAVLFEVEQRLAPPMRVGGLPLRVEELASHPYRFALKLVKAAERLSLYVDTAQLSIAFAESIAAAISTFAEALGEDGAGEIGALPLLSDAARARTIEVSTTPPHAATLRLIPERIAEQVARYPDRVAARDKRGALTYAALWDQAGRLARGLCTAGVVRGALVGLLLDRSTDALVGLLGILRAGGAYIPLSMEAPRARHHEILQRLAVCVVVTDQAGIDLLGPCSIKTLRCDQLEEANAAGADIPLPSTLGMQDLAYVIQTSGSTGSPKAVAIEHGSIARYTDAIEARLDAAFAEGFAERCLNFAIVSTLSADLGHTCLFPSLVTGGCLHFFDRNTTLDAAAFAAYSREHTIDVLKITPSHLSALLHAERDAAAVLPRFALFTGGEALHWQLARRIKELRPALLHINHYGPTEATVGALMMDVAVPQADREPHPTVPLGRPLPSVSAYVLDERRALVPLGAVGELFLGGANLARGYLGQPEETAERFVQDPWSPRAGARMYMTGDRVRRLPDGTLGFLGRKDRQMKLHGHRIEPGEIESACRRIAGIDDVYVAVREDMPGEKRIVAYVVFVPHAPPIDVLRALSAILPEPLLPSAVVPLAALPLTANGKVDEASLPMPPAARCAAGAPPRDELESTLVAIWCALLHLESVGIHDDFFELGGQSLIVTQLVARVGDAYDVDLPVHVVFDRPTIAELSAVIRGLSPVERRVEAQLGAFLDELEGVDAEELKQLLAGAS